jgi:hypothetical protein
VGRRLIFPAPSLITKSTKDTKNTKKTERKNGWEGIEGMSIACPFDAVLLDYRETQNHPSIYIPNAFLRVLRALRDEK